MKLNLLALLLVLLTTCACSGDSGDPSKAPNYANNAVQSDAALERASVICAFMMACETEISPRSAFGCLRPYTNDDYLSYLETRAESETRLVDCLLTASSCADYEACTEPSGAACEESRCDGDVAIQCVEGRESATDCFAQGLDCVESSGRAVCGVEGATCDAEFQCIDEVFIFCPGGPQAPPAGTNCENLGLTCNGICVDSPVQSCTESACNGSDVIYCVDGSRYTASCDLIDEGFECVIASGSTEPKCEQPQDQLECEEGMADSCDGDVAVTCVLGSLQRVDCSRVGATCTLNPSWIPQDPPSEGVYCEVVP